MVQPALPGSERAGAEESVLTARIVVLERLVWSLAEKLAICSEELGRLAEKKMEPEPFPPEVASVIDRAWAERESAHELDAEGRFVRGVYQGMTPDEVMADREAFRRCMPE